MSDSIHTNSNDTSLVRISPVDTLWGEHGGNIYLRTEVQPPHVVAYSGFEGKIAPQGLFSYNTSSGLLLLITLIYSYLLFRSRSLAKGSWNSLFKRQRERSSIFEAEVTAPEVRFRIFVRIVGVLGLGVYAYTFLADLVPHNNSFIAMLLLVGLAVFISLFLLVKYLWLQFLSYVFVGNQKTAPFIQAYFTIIFGLGVFVLPIVALQTLVPEYFIPVLHLVSIIACIIAGILLLYKIIQIFWIDYYSVFYIILYLCILEILPVLVGIRAIEMLNISL